jgi:ribosomal protein S18 acetylase RimI-like enzyme
VIAKEGGAVATIDIRECTHNDIDAVLTLESEWEQEAIAHTFVPISRDEVVASLTQFPSYFLVAEFDGRVVGYINGTVQIGTEESIIPTQEPYVAIENLYVTSQFRHKQVGGQLLERFMEAAEQQGLHRFLVGSNSKQIEKILTFYQDHGFKLWYVQLYK